MLRNLRRAVPKLRRTRGDPIAHYGRFVSPGDLVFDVGANMGERTAIFVTLGARVVAVEPQAHCAQRLRERFGEAVIVTEAAAGEEPGEGELLVASYHTVSSLSQEWVDEVRASGRFSEFTWNQRVRVPITTLDVLIARHGTPAFCKIDVEGYELGVLKGLSRPVRALSFEFTYELLGSRLECVERLHAIGMQRFNFSEGESMRLTFRKWMRCDDMIAFLRSTPQSAAFFGDVYAAA